MIEGRELELRRIAELLETARGGHAQSLVVRGEAGIGKTTLLLAAAESASAQGFRVLRVTGIESEAELAYSGLLELCRPVLDLVDQLAEPQRDALRSALALSTANGVERFAVSVAVLTLLADVAADTPLLVLLDDAQWLDVPSTEALWFAVRRLDADSVATIIGVRSGESRTLEDLRVPELLVEGVDLAAAASILDRAGSGLAAEAVIAQLHAGTAGNPLALIELARSLSRAQLAGSQPLADPLEAPATLQELFDRRVRALDRATRRALLVLAASGSDGFATVSEALRLLETPARALLPAADAELIRLSPGTAEFCHPLMRAAAYHGAPAADRQAAHLALADAAEEGSERRAWHRAEATLAPDEAVAAALEAVAVAARARSGFVAAGAALSRAAKLTPERATRARRHFAAADAFWAVGVADQARSLLAEAAGECDDARLMADIRHLEGHILLHSSAPAAAHELLLREGLAVARIDSAKAAFMIGEAAEAILYLGDFEQTLTTARVGQELRVDDGSMGEFFIAAIAGCGLVGTGHIDEGARELRRSIEIIETSATLSSDPRALGWLIPPYGWLDEYEAGLDVARRADAHARAAGALGDLVYVLPPEAGFEYLLGAWPQAYAHASEAVALAHETGQTIDAILALHGLAEIDAACGRADACLEAVAEGVRLSDEVNAMREWPAFALGLLELGRGRASDAAHALAPAVSLTLGQGQQRALMAVFDLVEAHVMCGDHAAARLVLDAVDAHYAGRTWEQAGAARGRGLLARPGEYHELFEASRGDLDRLGMRFEVARTELCWGERLRRDGKRAESRDHLRAALASFEALGARPWEARARNELEATGERLRRDRAAQDELSARELQVALQVATGKTNREAGAALFLSPKTVDIHLSRVYRKLGIHSRGELAGALDSSR